MSKSLWKKSVCCILFLTTFIITANLSAANLKNSNNSQKKHFLPVVTYKFLEKAKLNKYWKIAFVTGKNAQIVFMNVSPKTNPKNEIGMETHPFDQIVLVVQGEAKAVLGGKQFTVKSGDLIFIPQGILHNFINLNANKPFKIASIYSDTDIPANSKYRNSKAEAQK